MGYKVKQTIPAEHDLDGIVHYIAFKLKNPKAASDLLDEYKSKLASLNDNPRLYGLSQTERLARMGYRRFVFGNYIAFYTIDEFSKTIFVVRIFYQGQDYTSML